jgi:hypothetical protein
MPYPCVLDLPVTIRMNSSAEAKKTGELSLSQTALALLRYYVGGRRGLIVLAAAVAAGLYLSWGWLAAAGIAPLLVALAPCAAMCALGLCASRSGKSCSTDAPAKPLDGKSGIANAMAEPPHQAPPQPPEDPR